jgi:hypothetical protein
MPGRGTQQNLRNFEAISLRLEPLAMVNAETLLAKKLGAADTLRSFVNGGFGQKSTWRECLLAQSGRTAIRLDGQECQPNLPVLNGQKTSRSCPVTTGPS